MKNRENAIQFLVKNLPSAGLRPTDFGNYESVTVNPEEMLSAMSEFRKEFVQKELEWLEPILTASHPDLKAHIQARIEELKLMLI
jgi:hypothetical protein